jgi:hypothetical protein
MRHILIAGLCVCSLLFSITSSAQFNVNSLFAPIDFRLQMTIYESVSDETGTEGSFLITSDSIAAASLSHTSFDGWKTWSYVENYAFGKDRGAIPMITDLNALHPFFRDQITQLIAKCRAKGIELAVVETYRTHAKQHEYTSMGKKYTTARAGQSKHQYGLAVDVVPVINSTPVWDNAVLWRKIGSIGEKLGLRWGGRWKDPYDPAHFEWTGGLTSRHLGAGKFPTRADFQERYPCLDEDLKTLQVYWAEWETSQSAWTRK